MTDDEAAAWVRERADGWVAEVRADWAVVRDGAVAGRVALRTVDLVEGHAEVGYWVVPAMRGNGVATAALVTLTRWLLDELGLHRLLLRHWTRNEASCRSRPGPGPRPRESSAAPCCTRKAGTTCTSTPGSPTTVAYLHAARNLDVRGDAVPGAWTGQGGRTFLVQQVHVDPGTAKGLVDAAHTVSSDTGDLQSVGQALAEGQITYERAAVCVKAVTRLPKKLKTCTVTDETTGQQVTGIQAVDRVLARTIRDLPVRSVRHLTDRLVTLLDPDRKESYDEDAHLRRGVTLSVDATGMGILRATLTPADTAIIKALLAAWGKANPATTCLVRNPDGSVQEELVRDERTLAMRQCDGLMAAVRAAAGLSNATGRQPTDTEAGGLADGKPRDRQPPDQTRGRVPQHPATRRGPTRPPGARCRRSPS